MRREALNDLDLGIGKGEGSVGGSSKIARPLGAFEHLFWLADQHRPLHFTVTAEIEGKTKPDDWRLALDRAQTRHPLLSVSIADLASDPHFVSHAGVRIPLRVVEARDPSLSWQAEASEELARPFESRNPPLARAVLVHGSDQAALILALHHSIGDGMAASYVIRDVLAALAGEDLAPLPLSPSQEELALVALDALAASETGDELQQEQAGAASSYRPRDGVRPTVRGLGLPKTFTEKLRNRARREGTTVHGALLAALAIVGAGVSPRWRGIPIRVLSPINVRGALGAGEDCGLFVGAATNGLDSGDFDGSPARFWNLARHAKAGVASGQTEQGIVTVVSALQQAVENRPDVAAVAEFVSQAFAHEAVLSNLGQLPFGSRFGHLKLTSVWGPSVLGGFDGEQTVGVATVEGQLFLTQTSYTPPMGFLEEMQKTLVEACAS
jgi:hypothetical protein